MQKLKFDWFQLAWLGLQLFYLSDFSKTCLLTQMHQKRRIVFKSPEIPEIPFAEVCKSLKNIWKKI